MCTSLIHNGKKTIVGWNLDILDMEHKVVATNEAVYIAINDAKEGWIPLFGANQRGEFIAMPTCHPYDHRSDPEMEDTINIIMLNMDLLLMKKTFQETKEIVQNKKISSVPGVTFQAQLTDSQGNVLQIVPGQGFSYLERPEIAVMTNFSPFKGDREYHPWMGTDRYQTAVSMLTKADENFDVKDCFEVLKAASQTVCPTVVSMVYDVTERKIYWCENREWTQIKNQSFPT